jgi:hypothetical protein
MEYTQCQKNALIGMGDFLVNLDQRYYGLFGYAGTGKTTLIIDYIISLLDKKLKIAITAPTNKAVNILKMKLCEKIVLQDNEKKFKNFEEIIEYIDKERRTKLLFTTIHNYLDYKMNIDYTGQKVLIRNPSKASKKYNIVVVDECSMISEILANSIEENAHGAVKYIFIGDPAQLPPINEETSKIFSFEMKSITLENIVRSESGNIINISNEIRKTLNDNSYRPQLRNASDVHLYKSKLKESRNEWLKTALNYFKNNKNCVILAWTNRKCAEYNNIIRESIVDDKYKNMQYAPDDIIVLQDFYMNSNTQQSKICVSEQVKILTSLVENIQIAEVTNDIIEHKICESEYFKKFINAINKQTSKYYNIWNIKVTDYNNEYDLQVIHNDSKEAHKHDIEIISKLIRELRINIKADIARYSKKIIDTKIIIPIWAYLNNIFIESFANITYGFAISCHKSQGSSYENVFVDCDDITNNDRIKEAKQCIYTAITRSKLSVHIII